MHQKLILATLKEQQAAKVASVYTHQLLSAAMLLLMINLNMWVINEFPSV